jgi:hypothetical protein
VLLLLVLLLLVLLLLVLLLLVLLLLVLLLPLPLLFGGVLLAHRHPTIPFSNDLTRADAADSLRLVLALSDPAYWRTLRTKTAVEAQTRHHDSHWMSRCAQLTHQHISRVELHSWGGRGLVGSNL